MPSRKAGELFDFSTYYDAVVGDNNVKVPLDGSLDIVKLYQENLAKQIQSIGTYPGEQFAVNLYNQLHYKYDVDRYSAQVSHSVTEATGIFNLYLFKTMTNLEVRALENLKREVERARKELALHQNNNVRFTYRGVAYTK